MNEQRSWVRIPFKPEFFSGFLFATAFVAYVTAMIIHLFIVIFMTFRKFYRSHFSLRIHFTNTIACHTRIFFLPLCSKSRPTHTLCLDLFSSLFNTTSISTNILFKVQNVSLSTLYFNISSSSLCYRISSLDY